jgi:histidinol-phosphate aminotransferase
MMRNNWTVCPIQYDKLNLSNAVCFDRQLIDSITIDNKLSLFQYPNEYLVYQALSNYHSVPMQSLAIGFGLSELIPRIFSIYKHLTFKLITPTWQMAELYCQANKINYIKVEYKNFINLNLNDLYTNNADLLYIANPNGVNGQQLTSAEVLKLCDYYKVVVVDEAYGDYATFSVLHNAPIRNNLIVTKTFSKSVGVPGLRLGYCVANPQLIKVIQDLRPGYVMTGLTTTLIDQLLMLMPAHLQRMKETKQYLEETYKVIPSYSNSVMFTQKPNFNCVMKEVYSNIYRMALTDWGTLSEL